MWNYLANFIPLPKVPDNVGTTTIYLSTLQYMLPVSLVFHTSATWDWYQR